MSRRSVLLIEDNPGDALLVEEAVEDMADRARPELTHVDTLAAGLEVLAGGRPISCVLLDLGLPDATGLDGLRRLLDQHTDTPVVVLTGLDDTATAHAAIAAGAQDYLVKSGRLSSTDLDRSLRYAIERSRTLGSLRASNRQLAEFAGHVAHDLTSPLAGLVGFLDLVDATEESAGRLELAKESAMRLHDIVGGLLDYALMTADLGRDPDVVDLAEVARWVEQVVGMRLIEIGATVEIGDLPRVLGHEAAFRQVVQNLVTNSIKYRHPDRPLVIRIGSEDGEGGPVVHVADNGSGIEPAMRESVFEFGMQAAGDAAGVGLGLFAVRSVVEAMGGRVWVDPAVDVGTVVKMVLPIAGSTQSE